MMAFFGLLVALIVLVFVHELGHFIFAKLTRCRVDEFAVGFRPAVFEKKWGETNYLLGLSLLGGYVKIWGENGSEEVQSDPANPRAFYNRPRIFQAIVLLGGIVFNLLFAWLLFAVLIVMGTEVSQTQFPAYELQDKRVEVLQVVPGSPVDQEGIVVGSRISSISSGQVRARNNAEVMRKFIAAHAQEEMVITYETPEGEKKAFRTTTYDYEGKQIVGFGIETLGELQLPPHQAVYAGGVMTWQLTSLIVTAFGGIVSDLVTGDSVTENLSGPVGIAGIAGDSLRGGVEQFMFFLALLSINLAVFNLLPIPALDGGRLVFVAIESVIRRPINPKWFLYINAAGFALLILLMVWVTVQDIVKLTI